MYLSEIRTTELPASASDQHVYILTPKSTDDAFYLERTDRNIGWITREEQAYLRGLTVGIAGCGGMGGLVAQILLRAGIGTLKIADTEVFDASNINRQFGALQGTIGMNKALTTARMLRATSDDTTIYVYPKGITEEYVDHFIDGCDLILDEIEYWALAGRILLHRKAMQNNIHVINANTVGFGTRLFLFTPQSATIEECFGVTYEEAVLFEAKKEAGTATDAERIKVMAAVTLGLIPEFVNYTSFREPCGNILATTKRMKEEGKASIFGTNPPMASGFLADHAVLHLLRHSSIRRKIISLPHAPGYLFFDAAKMRAKIRKPGIIRHWLHQQKIKAITRMAIKKFYSN